MRRRLYTQPFRAAEGAPISNVNITPLIDVMLVLLIMFIITIPIATHKVPLDLPTQGGDPPIAPVIHRLSLDAGGRISWNGAPIQRRELAARLAAVKADPAAELHFRTDGQTRYDDFDRVLAEVKGAGITRLGLVDNGRFADLDR
jgi:biopolymer transport protein ExbD